MKAVRAYVIFGNPQTEEWETVAELSVEPWGAIDWGTVTAGDPERLKGKWNVARLPNGEEIEVMIGGHASGCTINVRQGMEAIAQLLGGGHTPSMIFRTANGSTVNIQVLDR